MPKLTKSPARSRLTAARIVWLAGCLHLTCLAARAQDFCAVTLDVETSDGTPATSTWIELVDPEGKVVRKEMAHGPAWRICDFGFGPHTLRVGTSGCLPVAISNIRLVFGSPLSLKVVLNGCGYQHLGMGKGCLLYFRVTDEDGRPVPGAKFTPKFPAQAPQVDSYGRFQSLFGGSQEFTFAAPGFEPATVSVRCEEAEEIDQMVVLRHRARQ